MDEAERAVIMRNACHRLEFERVWIDDDGGEVAVFAKTDFDTLE